MARLNIFLVGLVLAVASVSCSDIKVEVVEDINEYWLKNPNAELTPLTTKTFESGPSPYLTKSYTIGYRVNGDRLLAQKQESQTWSNPRDVNTNLHYPDSGIGAVVTYLEIVCDQSSNLGQAYVTSGGVGQRNIAVIIEARQTLFFSYRASIFGY